MARLFRWFIFGLVLGGVGIGMFYSGAWWQRVNSSTETSILSQAHSSTRLVEQRQAASDQVSDNRRNAITRAIHHATPAVVGITVTQVREYRAHNPLFDDPFFRYFFGVPDRVIREKVENLGSGVIVSSDGYIITNEHVVHNASEVVVTMPGEPGGKGKRYPAEILGTDYDNDLALLKISRDHLPFLQLAADDDAIVGEWAIAIGNPFGLFEVNDQPSVSVGVISAVGRDFERNEDGRSYKDMIQTDAAINPGNSGGPLVNVNGEIVGINTFIFSKGGGGSVGVGFAIPAKRVREIVEHLEDRMNLGKDFYTGLAVQDLDYRLALSLGYPSTDGVLVTEVETGSSADKAGLKPVDIIFEIGEIRITDVRSIKSYFTSRDLRIGDTIRGKYFRNGKEYEFKMILEGRKK